LEEPQDRGEIIPQPLKSDKEATQVRTKPRTVNSLDVIFLNVQCLRTKEQVLQLFVEDKAPDILCLCEHWLSKTELEFYQNLHNLTLVAEFCRSVRIRGGCSIYVKNGLKTKLIDLSVFCVELDLEICAVELVDLAVIVLAAYRSPDGDIEHFFELLERCLQRFLHVKKKVILCGDFNIHLERASAEADSFSQLLSGFGLYITSRLPTRLDACLDAVLTNCETWDYKVTVIEPMVADHSALLMSVNIPEVGDQPKATWHEDYIFTARPLHEFGFSRLRLAAAKLDWGAVIYGLVAEEAFNALFETFKALYDSLFPVKQFKGRAKNSRGQGRGQRADRSWYTAQLRQLKGQIALMNDLRREATGRDRDVLHASYLKLSRKYRAEVLAAKKKVMQSI